ncbi:MAG: DNA repair protein RadC [FCB group bacterium]|nr:DNA repair protein RadC [FCB group bacterium]
MKRIENILKNIPDKDTLIIGHAGEYWTDLVRYSTFEPVILDIRADFGEFDRFCKTAENGKYELIFVSQGLSKLLQDRPRTEKLVNLLSSGGGFIALELLDDNNSSGSLHREFYRVMTGSDILPQIRIVSLLKSAGLKNIRSTEFTSFSDDKRGSYSSHLSQYIQDELVKRDNPQSESLLKLMEKEDFRIMPLIFYRAKKKACRDGSETISEETKRHVNSIEIKNAVLQYGAGKLDDAELLSAALNLDQALAEKILAGYGPAGLLKEKDLSELPAQLGLDEFKTASLLALLELGKRLFQPKTNGRLALKSPAEAAEYLSDMKLLKKEQIRALYLNNAGELLWDEVISIGTLSRTLVSPRELLAPALEQSASALIVAHNHLNESPEPSADDIQLTARIENAAQILKVDLWDHIIISKNSYYSFNEAGRIKSAKGFNS